MQPSPNSTTPAWPLESELRHGVAMLRATLLQIGSLRKRAPGLLGYRIRLLDEQLENSANGLVRAVVKAGNLGKAEDYFDNEGALMWECLNEVRKCADPRQALAVLLALNAGQVIDHASGQAVNEMPFTEPAP